ncbi:Bug family tripartite tricarboxylate transporter substrate binding protein [Aureimonas populi]|uniref:Bug family tripartite tricarboxylate transporter substrate binding protein n=1 Tax=Aureimonas populi TaxID=1701758 RepID=A0ABW5CN27_9HYPH|nr:tripartite tricarboxylate transporter substrate binding protein [Aureimonas populi]
MDRRSFLAGAAGAASALAMPAVALAQPAYPQKPVTIVVPFPPGGSTDLIARRFAEEIGRSLGQPVVVENRGGAGGAVGANHVARSRPDGYTLLMGVTGSNAISAALRDDLPYDPVADFDPVSIVVSAPLALVVNADSPFRSVEDVVAFARENPGRFTHGTPGVGTSMHMTGELFGVETGTTLLHVPFRGSAEAMQALLGGQVSGMFGDVLVTSEYVKTGRLRALGVTSPEPHYLLPDVPPIAEAGVAGFSSLSWQGVFAPAGTPAPIVDALYAEISRLVAASEMQDFFRERGFIVESRPPAQSRSFVAEEVEKWRNVVEVAGIVVP